ncbi:hypothetical protein [Streptomyces caniferus]|uniref:hypothetical protein n=1 Tax=Streptomyces caniferus TaxID=285557 RepID=UPI00383A35F9
MTDDGAGFKAHDGNGRAPVEAGPTRVTAVQAAFNGLLQIRRLMNAGAADPYAVPAEWERNHVVRAVALALEAAGIAPSAVDEEGQRVATGYCVGAAETPGVARVEWLGPAGSGAAYAEQEALRRCAAVVRRLGWEALEYRGPRRRRYLEVEPPGRGRA